MPIDDPTAQDAATTTTEGRRASTADIVATLVLLVIHGGLYGATFVVLGLLVMSTDPCSYQKCGDPAWIDRAMNLGTWGGAALLVADVVVAVYLLVRGRRAFFVPIIGCLAQVALAALAVAMELRAGPV
ncbi:DUF6264 family protein [Mycobacterium intracellulare]|uniref:Uncharacterized protein n=1 Tax=Mycobacterium intracellulare TaxID=1767 RepID=A0A7R7MW09_MYCIT|nr:hypothetical protein CKJ67_19210 [Mycobacterium intracellulare]PBA19429.1 hypothetical protein CKJ68_19030 [Mycobacterium intracellulare]BCO58648.1 hypothetical protein MINTM005_38920 [Mycobacterium intracellulare]BCO95829.1 hypothetical protein MINTM016_38050 [Mycobacterium intracellulare]BCP01066.1 hypothetical protein MINTM018_38350 [Mycobacterium intracellulare]